MKNFKILSSALIICIICTLIGAGVVPTDSASPEDTVSLVSNGFHIIRSAESKNGVELSAEIYKALKERSGVSATLADDTSNEFSKEIIIGNCLRPEAVQAATILSANGTGLDDDYIVCEIDGDIVITGNSDEATDKAVKHFCNTYLSSGEIKQGTIDLSLASSNKTSIMLNDKKLSKNNAFIITPKYNMSYIVKLQVDTLIETISNSCGFTINESTDFSVKNDIDTTKYGYNNYGNSETRSEWEQYCSDYYNLDKTKTRTEPATSIGSILNLSTQEIVIGNCDRDGCPTVTDKEEYVIKVSGNRVFLNGGSPYATAMAVSEFARMVAAGDLSLTDDSSFTGNYYDRLSSYDKSSYYTVSWADDFEGDKINEALWHISYDKEHTYSSGLNGRENYRASREYKNNYVKDGKLYIDAMYDDNGYYGGMLITNDTMLYKYGYVEVSSLLPMGQGFWTSLWASSDYGELGYASTEIDINECYGPSHYVLGNTFAYLSTSAKNYVKDTYNEDVSVIHKRNDRLAIDNRGFYLDFHTFGYEWDENSLRFTADGVVYGEHNYATESKVYSSTHKLAPAEILCSTDAFHAPLYLRLSMALGYASRSFIVPDGGKEWTETNQYITDYLHIYQLENKGQTIQRFKSYNKYGDVNGDGSVDLLDAAMLERHLASWTRYDFLNMDLGAADMNDDGYVTNEDLLILIKMLAGHEGFWGGSSTEPDVDSGDGEGEWTPWE